MKKARVLIAGFLSFAAIGARAESFGDQVIRVSQETAAAAQQLKGNIAATQARRAQAGILNPAAALDEAVVGPAARFVAIAPGEFDMGSPDDEEGRDDDEIQHRVTISTGFEMQTTEVTQLQYFLVTGRNPSYFRMESFCDPGNFNVKYGLCLCLNHPVENISWVDAQKFLAELNRGQDRHTYRLPTEAEWEYAARAGTESTYSFGYPDETSKPDEYAWYEGNANKRTHAVAGKKANPWGLYDMQGNVWELVQDYFGDYPETAVRDPKGPATGQLGRVMRGGCWNYDAAYLRSALRGCAPVSAPDSATGFRLVRTSR